MVECKLVNKEIGLEAAVFLADDELDMVNDYFMEKEVITDKKEISINPKVVKWISEEPEFIRKAKLILTYLPDMTFEDFAQIFIRVIALGDRKGGILCVQNYENSEEFYPRFYQYLEEFLDPEYTEKIPPDFLMNIFVCMRHFLYRETEIDCPDAVIPLILNIKGDIPEFTPPPPPDEEN